MGKGGDGLALAQAGASWVLGTLVVQSLYTLWTRQQIRTARLAPILPLLQRRRLQLRQGHAGSGRAACSVTIWVLRFHFGK